MPFWRDFGGATNFWTSKSASSSNFALDRLIQRSVRPQNLGFDKNLGSPKNFHQILGACLPGGLFETASYHDIINITPPMQEQNFEISLATFWRIQPIVPGFGRILIRFAQIPGRSAEFAQKWRVDFSNFKRLKNREDSSDLDDFWTKSIAPTRSIFSKSRSSRRDRFGQKIVKIGAILAISRPLEAEFDAETPLLGEFSRSSLDSPHNPPQSGLIPGRSA